MSAESQASSERINLVYRSTSPDGSRDIELPFRLLILSNFTGDARAEILSDQEAMNINKDNFSKVLGALSPSITLAVPDKLSDQLDEEPDSLSFNFTFKTLADFNPQSFMKSCPILSPLVELRQQLMNIREKELDETALNDYLSSVGEDSASVKFIREMCEGAAFTLDILDLCTAELEDRLGDQLDAILHHDSFRELESAWRSVAFLIERTNFDENCFVEILNISKNGIIEDLEDAPEVIRSQLYGMVYTKEFGQFGGKPYSCILGNYSFGPGSEDVWLLQQLASIAAMAHAPFIAAPSPELFDIDSFSDLPRLRDLASNFEQPRFAKWNSFRQSEDARYVGLALPGFSLRPAYGDGNEIGIFHYQERFGKHAKGLWGSAAFAFTTRLLHSFATTRWCMNVVGSEHGKVQDLGMLGEARVATREKKIPTEILISDRRESELVKWGFIPLTVHKGEDNAAFYGASSVQNIREFANSEEGKNAALNFQLGAQLPYLFIVSRLSHYIKMMQREHIGSWKKGREIEEELNKWIRQYVADMDNPAANVRIRRPLRQAEVKVNEVDGKKDWYMIQLRVMPHLKYMGSQFTLNETGKLDKY
jgi:type VI secretion system protein ImpC